MSSDDSTREVTVEATDKQKAIEAGARKLGLRPEDVSVRVLQQGQRGFLGMFEKPWRIRVSSPSSRDSLRDATVEQAMEAARGVDGSFQLDVENRRIFLTVHPPTGTGEPVDPGTVIDHFNQIGLSYCDFDRVRNVVEQQPGEPVEIGQLPPEEDIDTEYVVQVLEDGLRATLNIRPPKFGGKPPSMREARRAIEKQDVSEGVDWDLVERMVETPRYRETVVFARGREPEPGEDATIEFFFEPEAKPDFSEREGQVDYRDLSLIQNVHAGDKLAEKREATGGRPGLTVRGDRIEAPAGEDVELDWGENVRREGNQLFAEIDGQVLYRDGRVVVQEIHTVDGDVDYSTGNIDFNGTVVVKGSVRDRFKVVARGDIMVEGGVGKSYLQAENDVVVNGGIRGKGGGQVNARGNIVAEFVEQANLIAQKNVVVEEMILHSRVDAGEGVFVTGARGLLAGGEIRAGEVVFARQLGSIGTSETDIEVGIDPVFFREIAKIELKIMEQEEKLDKIKRAIDTLKSRQDLGDEDRDRLEKLRKSRESLRRNIDNFLAEQESLSHQAEEREGARVVVEGLVHTGARIAIGNEVHFVHKREHEHCRFRKRSGSIQLSAYEEPEFPAL